MVFAIQLVRGDLPLLGIAINWYLAMQLPQTDLTFLVLFLSLVAIYFLFGYHFSLGNNGRWEVYDSCGLSIHCCCPRRQAAPCLSSSAICPKPTLSLSCTWRIFAFIAIAGVPVLRELGTDILLINKVKN
jgi:hypothetical protein